MPTGVYQEIVGLTGDCLSSRWFLAWISLASCLPVIAWFYLDNSYPISDAADFIMATYRAYVPWEEGRYGTALYHLYMWRPWKPVLFPVLGFPALVLGKGDVRWAVAVTMIAIQGILAGYVFALMKQSLTRWTAAIATLLVMTIPFVVLNGTRFFAESALCLSALAFTYHTLMACRSWRKREVTLAFTWFSILLLIRPVEGVLAGLGPAIYFFIVAWKAKQFTRLYIITWLTLVIFELAYLLHDFLIVMRKSEALTPPAVILAALLLPLLFLGFQLFQYRRQQATVFGVSLAASMFFIALWYVPHARLLTNWIYACTFGELTERTGNRELGTWHFYSLLFREGAWAVVLSFSMFLLWAKDLRDRPLFRMLLPSIVITLLMGLPVRNSDYRYYLCATMMAQIIVATSLPVSSRRLRPVLLIMALFFLGTNGYLLMTNFLRPTNDIAQVTIFGGGRRVQPGHDFHLDLDNHVAKSIKTSTSEKVMVGYIGLAKTEAVNQVQLSNPWTMGIVAMEQRRSYEYRFETGYNGLSLDESMTRLRCRREYVYIGPIGGSKDNKWNLAAHLGEILVERWRRNATAELGFIDPVEIKIGGGVGDYLLLKTVKPADCTKHPRFKYGMGIFD